MLPDTTPTVAGLSPGSAIAQPGSIRKALAATPAHAYRRQLNEGVITDADLIEWYLFELEGSPCSAATIASYRANLRRLGWYCRELGLSSIRHFRREDWKSFADYLADPPAQHIMRRSVSYGHPDWRPFRGALQPQSIVLARVIASGFFDWMAQDGIGAIDRNPLGGLKSKRSRSSATQSGVQRYLAEQDWVYIDRALALWEAASQSPADRRDAARARWVLSLGVLTGLRVSEMAKARVGMIRPGRQSCEYVLEIVRKGSIASRLPLHSQVLVAFERYRNALGITMQQAVAANLPLVMNHRVLSRACASAAPGDGAARELPQVREQDGPFGASPAQVFRPMSRQHIWLIIKSVMDKAGEHARSDGNELVAMKLKEVSPHWLRHTFGSRLLDAGGDLRSARDLLDHADLSTSSRYLHRDDEQRRSDLEKLITPI